MPGELTPSPASQGAPQHQTTRTCPPTSGTLTGKLYWGYKQKSKYKTLMIGMMKF